MSQVIDIYVDNLSYSIEWAISESFDELKGTKYMLKDMAAEDLVKLDNLSDTARLLLSATAGAVIQYLMDNNIDTSKIFNEGYFIVRTM